MKTLIIAAAATVLAAAPLFAQETGVQDSRGYVSGLGGFATSVGHTTGDISVEGGVRVAPHVMVFGNLGRLMNLQGDLQPTLDATAAALAANEGLGVVGGGSLPATYGLGGVRVEVPASSHLLPYVLGGVGLAHLNPQPQFTFASGTLPDGSTPGVGTDVTTALTTPGLFTTPTSENAFMWMLGGGVQVPVAQHWMVDAGYRFSRIGADSTLGASATNQNGMTFGFGYRF